MWTGESVLKPDYLIEVLNARALLTNKPHHVGRENLIAQTKARAINSTSDESVKQRISNAIERIVNQFIEDVALELKEYTNNIES